MSASLSCKDYLPFSPLDHHHPPGVHGKQTYIIIIICISGNHLNIQNAAHVSLSFSSLKDLPYTRHVTGAGLAKETDLYFMAAVERGTGKFYHSQQNWLLMLTCFELVFLSTCPYLSVPLSSSPGRRGAESPLPRDLPPFLPLPQLEGRA